jgi:hypothetical protein
MENRAKTPSAGQVLVGVLVLLVMMTLVPVMVLYTQWESKWTVKQSKNTEAFNMAESGIEKAYRVLSVSTVTWYNLTDHGTPIDRFKFDYKFDDMGDGEYVVSITSGPEARQATVISVGRAVHASTVEIRAIEAVFSQVAMGDIAVQGLNGVYVTGNNIDVDWGAILSRTEANINGRTRPQFWAASKILGADTDPTPPNCDDNKDVW